MTGYYELTITSKEGKKNIRIVAGSTEWDKYKRRIEREAFNGRSAQEFKVIDHVCLNEKIGLENL